MSADSSGPRPIPADVAEARLRALLKSGFGPGLPRREDDRMILLHHVAATLGEDETLDEKAITARLTEWIAAAGPRLETDAVTLRRALVDDGFVERDGRGQAYRRSRAYQRRVSFPPDDAGAAASTPAPAPDLAAERCVACRPDSPRLGDDEARALLREIPGWSIEVVDGVPRLTRGFAFVDFAAALAFAVQVGAEAEAEGHHPELLVEWGKVTVGWWTHAIGGLHKNDFIMAARTSSLADAARA